MSNDGLLGGAANSDPRDQGAAEEATAITALPAIQPGDLVLEVSGTRVCDVRFHLPRASWASLHVYSVTGTLIATIFAGDQPAGTQRITWDPSSAKGQSVPRGVYTFTLETPTGTRTTRGLILGSH